MKWKDNGNGQGVNTDSDDVYYENDNYSSYQETDRRAPVVSMRLLYWGIGIAAAIGLLLIIFANVFSSAEKARISALEQKISQLEQMMMKVDGVDEKVTRIWEQAKTFETFKTRFDRTEASMSLRMDRLATSLDAVQKKIDASVKRINQLEKESRKKTAASSQAAAKKTPAKKTVSASTKTHTVVAGDTLYSISKRYRLTVDELRAINKLSKGEMIHVGQTLKVTSSN